MVKPDGVARGLVGEIVSRVERRGLSIRAMRLLRVTPEQAAEHYAEHSEKPFYPSLVEFITSGPVVRHGDRGRCGRRNRPRDDGRHEPARLRRPARSAATTRSRSARTSCTAPTRPRTASARSPSTSASRTWCDRPSARARAHRPGIELPPPARDPRPARHRVHRRRAGLRRGRDRWPRAGRARRGACPRQGGGGRGRPRARRRHARRARRPGVRKAARRGRGAVVPGSARRADAHRPLGPLPAGRRRRARPPGRERGDVRPALAGRRRVVPRDGRVARPGRRLRRPGPRRGARPRGARATSRTSSACRSPSCSTRWRRQQAETVEQVDLVPVVSRRSSWTRSHSFRTVRFWTWSTEAFARPEWTRSGRTPGWYPVLRSRGGAGPPCRRPPRPPGPTRGQRAGPRRGRRSARRRRRAGRPCAAASSG